MKDRLAIWSSYRGIRRHSFILVASVVDGHPIRNAPVNHGIVPAGNKTRKKRGRSQNAVS